MTYKKLFPVEYNNKKFMIFLDDNNRRTFLELNNKEEYEYPILEDFIALNKIFNTREPYICYNVQKFNFKECVKVAKKGIVGILTVISIINSMPNAHAQSTEVKVNDSSIIVAINASENEIKEIYVNDVKELEQYIGHLDVTKEMVIDAIDNNYNLNYRYKRIAKEIVNKLTAIYPNIDLRIFYENIKTMNVIEYSSAEYEKNCPESSAAAYLTRSNTIISRKAAGDSVICHELCHAFNSYIRENENMIIVRDNYQIGLTEPLNEMTSNLVIPGGGYALTKTVVEYLMTLVDFTIEDFNNKGTIYILDLLKAKYPNSDIDYIKETLNSYNDSLIYGTITTPTIDEMEDLRDELFEMCLKEVSIDSGYTPFNNFAKIFYDATDAKLVFNYYERYNAKLQSIGYDKIIPASDILNKLDIYKDIGAITVINNKLMPLDTNKQSIINFDGSKQPAVVHFSNVTQGLFSKLSATIFEDYNIFGTEKYWEKLNDSFLLISPHHIMPIPIYMNGNLIATTKIQNLKLLVGEENGKLVFALIDENNQELYKTNGKVGSNCTTIPFYAYVDKYVKNISEIELSNYLNANYFNDFYYVDTKENSEGQDQTVDKSQEKLISSIIVNNKMIAKCDVKDLFLTIGKTKDGNIGYILTNKAGMIIYESAKELKDLSAPINFESYIRTSLPEIYLNDYLNEEFLSNFQKETGMFNNMELIGNQIVIDTSPTIIIQSNVNEKTINSTYKLSKLKVYVKNGVITLSSISSVPNESYDYIITVEDILIFSNILDKEIPQYKVTMEDLIEMTERYLENEVNKGVER